MEVGSLTHPSLSRVLNGRRRMNINSLTHPPSPQRRHWPTTRVSSLQLVGRADLDLACFTEVWLAVCQFFIFFIEIAFSFYYDGSVREPMSGSYEKFIIQLTSSAHCGCESTNNLLYLTLQTFSILSLSYLTLLYNTHSHRILIFQLICQL